MTKSPIPTGFDKYATLLVKPSGYTSAGYDLTVGHTYPVVGQMGCLVVLRLADGDTASIHPDQVSFRPTPSLPKANVPA